MGCQSFPSWLFSITMSLRGLVVNAENAPNESHFELDFPFWTPELNLVEFAFWAYEFENENYDDVFVVDSALEMCNEILEQMLHILEAWWKHFEADGRIAMPELSFRACAMILVGTWSLMNGMDCSTKLPYALKKERCIF